MKKFFYSILAAATMLFATTSCSQDEEIVNEGIESGMTQKVTFKVEMPGENASRAIADGVTVAQGNMANKLVYALYEKGNENRETPLHTGFATKDAASNEFSVSMDMVKGLEYTVLFLAYDADNSIFDVAEGDDLRSLDYKTELSSNMEAYDAFVACHTYNTLGGTSNEVHLVRPFAQINVGTTDTDLQKAAGLDVVVKESQLVIRNVPTRYNVFNGAVSEHKDVTYTRKNILTVANTTQNEKLNVEGTDYNYMNMVYVLAGEGQAAASTHSATFTFYRESAPQLVRTLDIPNLPIERNYRTNIVGDLLTKQETFRVIIDSDFYGDHKSDVLTVATTEELQQTITKVSAEEPGNYIIKFTDNIGGTNGRAATGAELNIVQKEGVSLTIDGAGYKFDGVITVNGDARAAGKEKLTFQNIKFETSGSDFTFISAPSKINNKYNYSHNVTIVNCTFKGNQTVGSASFTGTYNLVMKNCKATDMHSILQVQSCDNKVVVDNVITENCKNGISFGNTAYPTLSNSTINAAEYGVRGDGDASRGNLIIANTTINALKPIIIRKVTTDSYNVELRSNTTLTTTRAYHVVFTNGADDEAYVAPTGKYSITGAEEYNVYPAVSSSASPTSIVKVSTAETLIDALENNLDVLFLNDIKIEPAKMSNAYGATGINIKNGQTIDGNGYTLNIKGAGGTWDSGINTTGGLIKNITVTGSFRGIFINHNSDHSEKVVLDNVTIDGTVYTISCDQGLYQGIEATNCTFNGWTSFAKTAGEAKFINCSFGEGSGYKYCRPYSKTEFVNCTFCPGYTVDKSQAEVTFTNCTWEE